MARTPASSRVGSEDQLAFALREADALIARALAAPAVEAVSAARPYRANPKRLARAAAREQAARPVSTAAQEALARSFAQAKAEHRVAAERRRAAVAEERRARARTKAKARHRGR
ncbi:DUF2992 family protein [Streptomyces rimosus]|uniref:DUF2992 family protein n=1 Tax=Streptomyces rimosus TaxID=1927 RepID=UPI00067BCDE6|nr:DUF2992 family protein [Streptomyces rimosus]